jgi:flagellum-specific peptidoglycan hydrolase FlgJ
MQKWIYGCIAIVLFFTARANAQDTSYADKVAKYVAQYKHLAIMEQQRCGVPASITLGQGILETQAGCSELVTGANNHFGIKCKKEWKGETFSHTDDAPDECFRKYKCADDSYKDHSDYLKNSPRYASLFLLSKTDYPSWAIGLKRCGYATNPKYAQQLIKIIEDFKLQEYTYAAMNGYLISQTEKKEILSDDTTDTEEEDTTANFNKIKADADKAREVALNTAPSPAPQAPVNNLPATPNVKGQVIDVNGLKAIYGYKGDMLLQYAVRYKMRYEHLLEINDLPDAPLATDMYIYLEKKNTTGAHDTHIVKAGESLIQIAQLEGIQLKRLMVLNQLDINEKPATGAILQLQQPAALKPQLLAAEMPDTKPAGKIRVTNLDDFVATDKKPAEPINNAPPAEVQVTTPPPAVVKVQVTEETKPVINETPAPQPVSAAPATEDKKTAEIKQAPATDQIAAPPSDDLARLKAELDKVVYTGNGNTVTATPVTTTQTKPANNIPETKAITSAATGTKYYTVKKGDTAFNIARQNNITVHQLMEWNKLNFDEIKIGQHLRVKE